MNFPNSVTSVKFIDVIFQICVTFVAAVCVDRYGLDHLARRQHGASATRSCRSLLTVVILAEIIAVKRVCYLALQLCWRFCAVFGANHF